MAYGDFKEVKEIATGDEGEGGKKPGINMNDPKQFTQEIANKWLENDKAGNITLSAIERKKAMEVAKYGS